MPVKLEYLPDSNAVMGTFIKEADSIISPAFQLVNDCCSPTQVKVIEWNLDNTFGVEKRLTEVLGFE